ncbi:glycosyl transferase family 2, partial [gut metagenome]
GQFVSYHVYPYYPDYLDYIEDWSIYGLNRADYAQNQGKYNTYRAYLQMLNNYHTMPVVISEFGVSTGRGMAQRDGNTGRNQGNMSEQDQGQALVIVGQISNHPAATVAACFPGRMNGSSVHGTPCMQWI